MDVYQNCKLKFCLRSNFRNVIWQIDPPLPHQEQEGLEQNQHTKLHVYHQGNPKSKSVHASKVTDSSKKPKGKKTPGRPPKQVKLIPTEKKVTEIDSDNSEEGDFPFHQLELPDLPPMEAEQPNQVGRPNQVPAEEQQQNQVPLQPLDTPMEEPIQPNQHNQPNQPQNIIPDPMANPQQLNWSYFKPEFAGKMDEDAKAHLLRTNDWMDTHNFPNDQKNGP